MHIFLKKEKNKEQKAKHPSFHIDGTLKQCMAYQPLHLLNLYIY